MVPLAELDGEREGRAGVSRRKPGSPRVLVSVWSGLGDIMFATPAIRHLRRALPGAFIAVAGLAGGPGGALLETNSNIDEVYFSRRDAFSPAGVKEALGWARSREFEVGVELSHPAQWFFAAAGIRERHRFARRSWWWAVPYRDRKGVELHASEHLLRAVERAFGPVGRDGLGYDLELTASDEKAARALISGLDGAPFVAMHPGARCNANKRWGVEKFAGLARRLSRDTGMKIALVGGPEDADSCEMIRRGLDGSAVVLAGKASLRETAAVAGRAVLYVGNDSGPLQMAAGTGTPVVGIFASSSPASFGPLAAASRVVTPDDPCAPCLHFSGYTWLPWGLRLRYYDRCRAMEGLGVEPVYEACLDLL